MLAKAPWLWLVIGEMDFPNYRKKAANGKPLSRNVEALKKKIREKYAKKITPYFHDIILHIGDNQEHTVHMNQILNKNISIPDFLKSVNGRGINAFHLKLNRLR